VTAARAVPGDVAQLIMPLRDDPRSSAILCDIDGTLAPIVPEPERARVPPETQEALRVLAGRFALVACVSGRRAVDARRLVGVDELTYAGNHGLELLHPGEGEVELDPAAGGASLPARDFIGTLDAVALGEAGMTVENKGPIQALHWRTARDGGAAEQRAREIAAGAEAVGLVAHWGRKVLEIRPTGEVNKGTAVRRLVGSRRVQRALFAGDDRTDLDAFDALRAAVAEGSLRSAVCLGISSEERPRGLAESADALLGGLGAFVDVLRSLARPRAAQPAGGR
jgi:trehalose 6-phosphate phosphatase